jgi:hypothetical protein
MHCIARSFLAQKELLFIIRFVIIKYEEKNPGKVLKYETIFMLLFNPFDADSAGGCCGGGGTNHFDGGSARPIGRASNGGSLLPKYA